VKASIAADDQATSGNSLESRRRRWESPESPQMTSRVLTSLPGRRCSGETPFRRPVDASICCDDFETRFSPKDAQRCSEY